ncbi:putative large-conductance mechanosensitive channel [Tetraselmis virus 1]|uniref:Putative large-conductance mechanosensitive channel n=1 Tax=Tetraselmis virus 1 TaxID=2060617 RepID=A0A2P0VML5_9VIRU|nr:putative large-conductance mechanosensitive channel [Tetraselmis virus 1]AUF82136.1 putative large-conductance mechanosensitive channel [Tetraselmis virus 1]
MGAKKPKYKNFVHWLDEKSVISVAVAFSVSMAVNRFMQTLIDNLVIAIISKTTGAEDLEWEITKELSIKYGKIIVESINLMIILYLSYLIIKASNRYLGWT